MKKNNLIILSLLFVLSVSCALYANTIPVYRSEIFAAAKAGDAQAFKKMIEQKYDLNLQDKDGNTLFHIAAQQGHADIIEILSEYDDAPDGVLAYVRHFFFGKRRPDVDANNNSGDTALHCSLESDELEALLMLIFKNADPEKVNKYKRSVLLHAAEKGKKAHVMYLMNVCDSYYKQTVNQENILHIALRNDNQELAHDIITFNHDICAYDRALCGNNALITAKNAYGQTPLLYCAKKNMPQLIKLLLQSDATDLPIILNEHDNQGYSPFAYLCYQKNTQELRNMFLQHNVNLNQPTRTTAIPLHILLRENDYKGAEKLLQHGANIDIQDIKTGNAALHNFLYDKDIAKVYWLLYHKANVNIRNHRDEDCMAIALEYDDIPLMEKLIKHGGNINSRDKNGHTLVMKHMASGNNDAVANLITLHADLTLITQRGLNLLHIAAQQSNKDGAAMILNKQHKALLQKADKLGYYPLHYAAQEKKSLDLLMLYIKNGAEINETNRNNAETALHCAAKTGNLSAIQYLKNNNATLSMVTKDTNTPAHYALSYDHFDCFYPLLNKTVVNTSNAQGKTVVHLAIEKHFTQESLKTTVVAYEANMEWCNNKGDSYLHYAINAENTGAVTFFTIPSLINKRNYIAQSPLSCAVRKKNPVIVKHLLFNKAQVNIQDNTGATETHYAADFGDEEICALLYSHGANFEKRDDQGNTCAHRAARSDQIGIINFLKSKNCDFDKENDAHHIPFEVAVLNDRLRTATTLIKEDYFINKRVQRCLQELQRSPMKTQTQAFLEQQINARNTECTTIIDLQNQLKNIIKTNQTYHNLLKQRAIKEYSSFAYTYATAHDKILVYSYDSLQNSYQPARLSRTATLQQAIADETEHSRAMKTRLDKIEQEQRAKDAKEVEKQLALVKKEGEQKKQAEEKKLQEKYNNTQTTQDNQKTTEDAFECELCNEQKTGPQRHCVNDKCAGKHCLGCINEWKGKGKNSCPYCTLELKK